MKFSVSSIYTVFITFLHFITLMCWNRTFWELHWNWPHHIGESRDSSDCRMVRTSQKKFLKNLWDLKSREIARKCGTVVFIQRRFLHSLINSWHQNGASNIHYDHYYPLIFMIPWCSQLLSLISSIPNGWPNTCVLDVVLSSNFRASLRTSTPQA